MAPDLPKGIFRLDNGYRVYVWTPDPGNPKGRIKSKRFKADTPLATMKQWREDQRVDARRTPSKVVALSDDGFAADALAYLDAVRAMPSYKDRVRDIGTWIAVFGNGPTKEITSTTIRTMRDQWLTVGPKRVLERVKDEKPRWAWKPVPLSASTVNHRLRALENFFTVMSPGKPNPVREVPEATEPDAEPRGQSFAIALEILSCMPDRTTPTKGGTHEPGSLSRIRFETMLWTGLPAVQVARLKPELVDWIAGTVLVPRRQKGKQSRRARRRREHPRPLLPQAQDALKRFFALGANQHFSSTSLARSVRRAIRTANRARTDKQLPPIPDSVTVYDLTRHTFGTEVYDASRDLKATQELMGHSDINQTARYAMAAVNRNTLRAITETASAIDAAAKPVRKRPAGRLLSERPARSGKVSPRKSTNRDRSRRKAKQ